MVDDGGGAAFDGDVILVGNRGALGFLLIDAAGPKGGRWALAVYAALDLLVQLVFWSIEQLDVRAAFGDAGGFVVVADLKGSSVSLCHVAVCIILIYGVFEARYLGHCMGTGFALTDTAAVLIVPYI